MLAYSLIMLNTLNHNPRVNTRMKLTEAQFVKQCKDVAPGYPSGDFRQIYYRICEREF